MGKSIAAPERMTAAERRAKAIELRKLGLTYRQIGEQVGVTESGAHKIVIGALRDLNAKSAESAADLRRLETERLDQLLVAVVGKARQGHLGAVDRVLRIMQRRARLWGLDAPTTVKADSSHVHSVYSMEEMRAHQKKAQDMTDEELFQALKRRGCA